VANLRNKRPGLSYSAIGLAKNCELTGFVAGPDVWQRFFLAHVCFVMVEIILPTGANMAREAWTCPYCQHLAAIDSNDRQNLIQTLFPACSYGTVLLASTYTVCPNPSCQQFSLSTTILVSPSEEVRNETWQQRISRSKVLKSWNLMPASSAKVFPSYVPQAIRQDYEEACLIRDLSPKAAATLARRALQGMVRDFWGIHKSKLKFEIDDLKGKIDDRTWQAIDAVRKVGNIGAHMEQDVNLIIDVSPDEAAKLLLLIEILVKDWYIARAEKEAHLKELAAIGRTKDKASSKPN
jgi:hypothetical protein